MGYDANSADPVQMPQNAASDQDLHCLLTEISVKSAVKIENPPEKPKTRNGIIQMIRMDKSTSQKRVNKAWDVFLVKYSSVLRWGHKVQFS